MPISEPHNTLQIILVVFMLKTIGIGSKQLIKETRFFIKFKKNNYSNTISYMSNPEERAIKIPTFYCLERLYMSPLTVILRESSR